MTWNWNHTPEAYDNVYYNISQLPLEILIEIAAEITTYTMVTEFNNKLFFYLEENNNSTNWNKELYTKFLTNTKFNESNKHYLVDFIFKFASEQAECTNGGHEAFVCPYGCHLVSFSRKQ
jgi:hypothetical protein